MERTKHWLLNFGGGIFMAALILLGTTATAQQVAKSKWFLQSRFVTTMFKQESLNVASVVTSPQKLDAMVKFLGAVTTAYINFEMIPVNEARTFAVIFECLDDDLVIDSFVYRGKTLVVTGEAPSLTDCQEFQQALKEKDYFQAVTVHRYTTVEDKIRFEMECGL